MVSTLLLTLDKHIGDAQGIFFRPGHGSGSQETAINAKGWHAIDTVGLGQHGGFGNLGCHAKRIENIGKLFSV